MKRIFDLFFCSLGFLLLSPLFLVISVAIRLGSPGPLFFRQVRVGRYGRPFRIFKFRTMYAGAETRGHKITVGDDPRITRAAQWRPWRAYGLIHLRLEEGMLAGRRVG